MEAKNEVGLDGFIEARPSEANVARYTGHVNSITCMFVIDDAKEAGENLKTTYIFTGGYDQTARCFNAESGECLYVYRGHSSFVFTLKVSVEPQMSKKYADVIESTKWFLYTGSYDGTVKRWDIATGECTNTYDLEYGDENPRFRAGVITLLEICEMTFFTVTADKILRAWNVSDGELAWSSNAHRDSITGLQLREKFETSDEFRVYESPAELFTCSTDKTVRVWVPATGECKRILRFDTQPLYAMWVRLDGKLFVGAGSSIIYCDGETGKAIRSFSCRHGAVKCLCADNLRVYAGTGFVSQQFNINNGFLERSFGGHKGVLTAVQLHDRTLYTTGDDAVVTWDTDPVLFACMDGDLKTLRVLLAGTNDMPPVDPELRTGSGNSALLLAGKAGQSEIMESLLMYSADVHRLSRAAAEKGVRVLLKGGANPNFSTPSQDVYLDEKGKLVENFRVAAFGHIDGDQTPLHYAAKAGSATCCKLLIEGAADSNFKDSYLRTPVHIAAQLGAVEALSVLLSTKCIDTVFNRFYEADFSLKDITGKTPLKLATVWECKRLIWKRYMERWAQKSFAMRAVGSKLEIPPMEAPSWKQPVTRRPPSR